MNLSPTVPCGTAAHQPPPRALARTGDEVSLEQSAALLTALADTPDVRPEEVERAKQLIGDVRWPPEETIRRIAELLAINSDRLTN